MLDALVVGEVAAFGTSLKMIQSSLTFLHGDLTGDRKLGIGYTVCIEEIGRPARFHDSSRTYRQDYRIRREVSNVGSRITRLSASSHGLHGSESRSSRMKAACILQSEILNATRVGGYCR